MNRARQTWCALITRVPNAQLFFLVSRLFCVCVQMQSVRDRNVDTFRSVEHIFITDMHFEF